MPILLFPLRHHVASLGPGIDSGLTWCRQRFISSINTLEQKNVHNMAGEWEDPPEKDGESESGNLAKSDAKPVRFLSVW